MPIKLDEKTFFRGKRGGLFLGAPLFNPRSDGSDAGNKRKQKGARNGAPFCLELLAGLVRSEATEQRLFAEGAIASRYFGSAGSSQSKSSEFLFGALHGATGRI